MKLKEVDKELNVSKLKIKLTDSLKKAYENYSSKGEEEVYLVGPAMGDWFISPNPPESEERVLYPMPIGVEPMAFLECEVII